MTSIDFLILDFIQTHIVSPVLTPFFEFFTRLGNGGMLWIAIGVLLILFKKTRIIGIGLLASLLIEDTICGRIIKPLVQRPRPFVQNPDITLLIPKLSSYSFPSGHTASSFCAAVYLYGWNKKAGIPAIITALLIALSRLYFYVHFPSDVICGFLLGTAVGLAGSYIVRTQIRQR